MSRIGNGFSVGRAGVGIPTPATVRGPPLICPPTSNENITDSFRDRLQMGALRKIAGSVPTPLLGTDAPLGLFEKNRDPKTNGIDAVGRWSPAMHLHAALIGIRGPATASNLPHIASSRVPTFFAPLHDVALHIVQPQPIRWIGTHLAWPLQPGRFRVRLVLWQSIRRTVEVEVEEIVLPLLPWPTPTGILPLSARRQSIFPACQLRAYSLAACSAV